MHLTQFIRDRTDVELERLTREGTLWSWKVATRFGGTLYSEDPGCLLCNAFDRRYGASWESLQDLCDRVLHAAEAELSTLRLETKYGPVQTGALIARLARRELGRRALAAIGPLTATEPTERVEVGR